MLTKWWKKPWDPAEKMGVMLEWSHAVKTYWIKLKANWEGATEERKEPWVGYGDYGEQSGAKWGWITRQQPVPPYYPPSSPTSTLSKPPQHHHHRVPLLSGVTPPVTLQWHHHWLLLGEWRERETERRRERQREGEREGTVGCSSHGGLCNHCAYFMGAQCHWSRRLWVSITNGIMLYFSGKLNTNKTHLLDVAWHFLRCIYFSSSR